MAPRSRPQYEQIDVPQPFIDLAQRRTEFLFHVAQWSDVSMRNVLASAYLQGLGDAADAIENRDKRQTEPAIIPWHT